MQTENILWLEKLIAQHKILIAEKEAHLRQDKETLRFWEEELAIRLKLQQTTLDDLLEDWDYDMEGDKKNG